MEGQIISNNLSYEQQVSKSMSRHPAGKKPTLPPPPEKMEKPKVRLRRV